MNKLTFIGISLVLTIFISSCDTFKEHKTFIRRFVEKPEIFDSLYRNSVFFDSINVSNVYKFINSYRFERFKKYFSNKDYDIIRERSTKERHLIIISDVYRRSEFVFIFIRDRLSWKLLEII